VTDIHVGRVTPMAVQYGAVELVNHERPDLVALTGDFVCHSQDYLDALTDLVRRYDAPVFAVLGNHDHWAGADEVRHALRRAGAEVLDNVNTTITLHRQRLQIVGLDDAYTSHASRAQAIKGLRHDLPTLGLSHIAEEADGLWAAGVPLVLSGHTHAGQITFARLHELAIGKLAGHKYVHGLYGSRREREGGGAVYVGAGIGASVMPLRIGERGRREVTLFELGLAPGSIEEHHEEQPALAGRKPSPEVALKRHFAVHVKKAKRDAKKQSLAARDPKRR
jgi:predicted MPP superfamily phosphohydrolase